MKVKQPTNESERIQLLKSLNILDSEEEAAFDEIAKLAAYICGTKTALIGFIAEDRHWLKARVCFAGKEASRDVSFCAHTILESDILIVPDVTQDSRFADNPLVVGEPFVRFYAGVPIRLDDDKAVGTVCVIDYEPRELTAEQINSLKFLANQVSAQLELRRIKNNLDQNIKVQTQKLEDEIEKHVQTENLLQAVLDTIPQAVFWKDRQSTYLGANREFAEDAGFVSPDMLIGKTDYEMPWSSTDADSFVEYDQRIMATDEAELAFEEGQLQADGKMAWVRTNKVPIHSSDGEVIGILGTYEDITEEKIFQEQNNYLANLLEQVSEAVISVDMKFNIRSWNKGAETIYGYSAEEAIGNFIGNLIQTEYEDYDSGEGSRILLETGIFKARATQTTHNGRKLYISTSSSLLRDDDGNPAGMVAINRDIGMLVEVENERERLTSILQQTSDFVGIADVDGNTLFVNASGQQMVGLSVHDDVTKMKIQDFHPEEVVNLMTDKILPQTVKYGLWQGETSLRTRDGTDIPVSQVLIAQKNRHGEVEAFATIMRDMTAQKVANEQHRKQSERLQLAMAGGKIGIWEWIIPTNEVYWSDNVETVLGLETGTFDGTFEMYQSLIHPDDADDVNQALGATLEQDAPYDVEHRLLLPDGTIGWLAGSGTVTRDENGRPIRMLGTVRNITDQKQDEQERLAQSERLRLAMAGGKIGIWEWIIPTNEVFWSDNVETVLGLEAGTFDGTFEMYQSLIHPNDADDVNQALGATLEQDAPYDVEHRLLLPNGTIGWLSGTGTVSRDENGRPVQMLGTVRNITNRKQIEIENQNQASRLELAISRGEIAIWEFDRRRNSIFWSDNVEAVLGIDKKQFDRTYDGFMQFVHPEDFEMVNTSLQEVYRTGISISLEYRIIRPDGTIGWLAGNASMLRDENDEPLKMVGTYSNITERKQAELKIQSSLQRRSDETRLITEIAQSIAGATNLLNLYKQVVWLVNEQFNYYHTQILRYDPALDTLELVVGYGEVGEQMLALNHSMPVGVGLIGTAAAQKRPMLRSNVTDDHNWRPNPLLPQTKGELAVPIIMQDMVLGVLDVQSAIADALDENDQYLLEGLCGQIAIAIESTRLREEMEANIQELSALQRYFVREGWDKRLVADDLQSGYLYKRGELLPLAQNGENGNKKIIEHPLAVRGEAIGQIGIAFEDEQALTSEEEQFLQAVSRQVAEALESVRLMEQTQTSLYAQEQLSSDLRTVAEVSSTASEALEVETLLQAVVDLSKKRFNLYHVHIYLFDEWQYELSLVAGSGDIGQLMVLEGQKVRVDTHSVVGRAAKQRDVVVVNDVERADYFIGHPLLPRTKAEMAVPLLVGESLLGVLDVHANKMNRFDEQDVMIMKTLASQIAVSLQNANLYAEQVETADKLRSVDQLKSEFLASMSHELRTPLNSIIGFADVLLEGFDGPLTERMEEDVRLIRDSGRHLKSLIGDILDLSKIEAGRMELRYEQVDINQMAKDVVATSMSLAQEKSLYLDLHVDDTITTVPCDQVRIRQVLINVVGNGIKFTEKGGVTVTTANHQEHVLISITDTGIGIKQEDIDIVFEQFRQVDGSMTRAAGGTGLGMPISKKLVELHGGDIWIESTVGEGSTFFFTIPHTPSYRPPETDSLGL